VSTATKRVLVIDDDANLADVVGRYLQREGFEVEIDETGPGGLERALQWLPDLVILDLMLPGLDGFEVFRRLREVAPIPVVMLTARGDEDDRVAGLELGADDYLAKPFSPRELAARVRAVLRRAEGEVTAPAAGPLVAGDLRIDRISREAFLGSRQLTLTAKEFDLLVHLMERPNEAIRREALMEAVWGWSYGDTATVTVHVHRLREKIEVDPSEPAMLQTVWGVGYRFVP
jgi:DNA-binding response OmpR family regulator